MDLPANDNTLAEFNAAWERLKPTIEASLKRLNGTATIEGLYQSIISGQTYFFCGKNTFALGYIMQHETCRTFNSFLASGDGAELLEYLVPMMERFAIKAGCKFIHMDVREGFIGRKDHVKLGYRVSSVCVTKDLEHGQKVASC